MPTVVSYLACVVIFVFRLSFLRFLVIASVVSYAAFVLSYFFAPRLSVLRFFLMVSVVSYLSIVFQCLFLISPSLGSL